MRDELEHLRTELYWLAERVNTQIEELRELLNSKADKDDEDYQDRCEN
jgi:hypothetical protein